MLNSKKIIVCIVLLLVVVCISVLVFLSKDLAKKDESNGVDIVSTEDSGKDEKQEGNMSTELTDNQEATEENVFTESDDKAEVTEDVVAAESVEEPGEERVSVVLEFSGDALIMTVPESWKNQFDMEPMEESYVIYNSQIREGFGGGGTLFTVYCYDGAMTESQYAESGLGVAAYRYLFATENNTYIVHYPTDVQHDSENPTQQDIYTKLTADIEKIQFAVK